MASTSVSATVFDDVGDWFSGAYEDTINFTEHNPGISIGAGLVVVGLSEPLAIPWALMGVSAPILLSLDAAPEELSYASSLPLKAGELDDNAKKTKGSNYSMAGNFINALPKNAGEAFHIGAGVSSIIMDLKDKVVNAGDWFNESTEKGYCWLESGISCEADKQPPDVFVPKVLDYSSLNNYIKLKP
jgi:hypothetical protein